MAFAIVNGTVQRTFFEGKGASVKETFTKRDGTEGASYYTAFFDAPHGLSDGDTGKFSGLLSAKVSSYEKDGETRHSADIVLNSAKFEAAKFEAAEYSDDTPF